MGEKVFLPNIKVYAGDISSKVIVCGDPGRAKQIAELLDEPQEISFAREYRIFNGVYQGTKVTIASHGVGCPGAAVCFEELIKAGAKEIIRVGTAGSYVEELPPGSLIVADSAVREDGLTYQLVPKGMPAVGDLSLVQKVEKRTATKDIRYKRGTIVTLDVFYSGAVTFPHMEYKAAGALGAEMELASLYIIARMRGIAAAGIFALDGYAFADMNEYDPHTEVVGQAVKAEIEIALEVLCGE
ncbi:nucleoside phosphorylase [Enterococcus crotali]